MTPASATDARPGGPTAKRQPSPEGLGINPEEDPSAVGAALCHRSEVEWESASNTQERQIRALRPAQDAASIFLSGCAQSSHTAGFSDADLGKARFSVKS